MTSNQASGKTTARQIRIVGVVVFGAFLALLNQTVMSPALPAIMTDFGIDASTAQWIMSIYPLVSGIMVPVSAFLIDRFSTRVLFFAATAAFAAGTALCAAAPTFFLLICGRVLQAAASGVLLPLVSVVPMLVFPVEKRGTAMGVAGIVMSAGPAVGPVLGGAIIDAYGWRVTLGCIVPLALAVLLCGVFLLENVGEAKRPKLDVASIALSTIAFGGLLYGFSSASTLGWTSIAVLGTIIAGIVCLIAFVKRQLTLEEPLLDLRCLKSSDFAVAAIVVTLINAACLVTNTLLPILLQTAMGASALETGIVMLPAAAAGILISPISGIVFDKFGPRTISQSQASTAPISRVACDHNKPNHVQGRENRARTRPRKARRRPPWGRTIIMKRQEHFERIFERHPHRMHPVSGSRLPYHRPLHDPPIPSPGVGTETPYRDRLLVRVLPDVRVLPRAAAASRRPHGVCRLRGDAAACSLQLRP